MTHTPGPWAVNPSSAEVNCGTLCDCGCGGLLPVAQMLWPTDQRSEDETFANARLIASAPDLLADLQYAVKLLRPFIGGTAQIERMDRTIAKALAGNVEE